MTRKPSGKGDYICVWNDKTLTTFEDQPLSGLTNLNYPWRKGQPDHYGGHEECIYMYSTFAQNELEKSYLHSQWNDYDCNTIQIGSACKKKSHC